MKLIYVILAALLLTLGLVAFSANHNSIDVVEAGTLPYQENAVPRGYARLHDRESGAEVLCFRDSADGWKASISCVATGRNWK